MRHRRLYFILTLMAFGAIIAAAIGSLPIMSNWKVIVGVSIGGIFLANAIWYPKIAFNRWTLTTAIAIAVLVGALYFPRTGAWLLAIFFWLVASITIPEYMKESEVQKADLKQEKELRKTLSDNYTISSARDAQTIRELRASLEKLSNFTIKDGFAAYRKLQISSGMTHMAFLCTVLRDLGVTVFEDKELQAQIQDLERKTGDLQALHEAIAPPKIATAS